MRRAFLAVGLCTVASAVVSACMTRPVTSTEPHTSNLFVAPIHNEVINKIDLLFMIDNSQSMGDKQKLLAQAVPQLVDRLVVPRCVAENGETHARTSLTEACPANMAPEFRAVRDIHVAVITSSLGSHGASNGSCAGSEEGQNDRSLLLPKVRTSAALANYNKSGFLAWDPDQKLNPTGESDAPRLKEQFANMVKAAGENGCGYESSLESWYRFLIDPEPPLTLSVPKTGKYEKTTVTAIDTEVLAQRDAFLRPDSLVAIVMLTDENDCSIRDEEYGNVLSGEAHAWRGNSACAKDPNDPCCLPCLATTVPQGCTPNDQDPVCIPAKEKQQLSDGEDHQNMRCFDNKRRFGYDFLYPTSRYVNGLTQLLIRKRSDGSMVENPLYKLVPGKGRRSPELVYLAGIVGVPWQDIADDASRTGPGLRYFDAKELAAKGRWDVILGDSSKNQPPSDPFMQESMAPRLGKNPVTGDVIAPATSTNPRENAINGHEQVDFDHSDLQYACTFALSEPVACPADPNASCDCIATDSKGGPLDRNRPLCQPPGGGSAGTTQYFGKAYPGLRSLEVLKGIGNSAIVASICPKVLTPGMPGYGYEPAVDAIIARLTGVLAARCLPRPLAVESTTAKLPCVVVEAQPQAQADAACSCNGARRQVASTEAQNLVRQQLAARLECGTEGTPPCSSFCLCELAQAEGLALDQCLNTEAGSDTPGYCYVHPFDDEPQGNAKLVAGCGDSEKQLIRFVGPDTPTPGATTFIACLGATIH